MEGKLIQFCILSFNDCLFFLIGYSIFVVTGELPSCEANELLTLVPIQTPSKTTKPSPYKTIQDEESDSSEDVTLAMAISASLAGIYNTYFMVFVRCDCRLC